MIAHGGHHLGPDNEIDGLLYIRCFNHQQKLQEPSIAAQAIAGYNQNEHVMICITYLRYYTRSDWLVTVFILGQRRSRTFIEYQGLLFINQTFEFQFFIFFVFAL